MKKIQLGFTLVELMVAITIGMIVLASIMQLVINAQTTYRVQSGFSKIQENGRFAMFFLESSARSADYSGCSKAGVSSLSNRLDPTGTGYTTATYGYTSGVSGTDGGVNATSRALDPPDTLILKGAFDNIGIEVTTPYMNTKSAAVHIATTNTLAKGDIILISDCQSGDIFQVSNSNPQSGALDHNTGAAISPGNISNLSKTYGADASVYKISTVTYSIGNDPVTGDSALLKNGAAMIPGVQNMQVLYGEDTDADKVANYYVSSGSVVSMDNVVSLKVSLLVASDANLAKSSPLITYNGGTTTVANNRLSRVFTSTIAIRNRLG